MGKQPTSGCRPWLQNVACLSFLLIGAGQQGMTVPQIGFVPPAGKPQHINWQPKRRICISRKCLSHVLNRPLGYVPTIQVSLTFEVNLFIALKFER